MGKGSKKRPTMVDRETYESNWDRAFKKPELSELEELVLTYLLASAIVEVLEEKELPTKDDVIH
jgi:hypothetical protein